MAIRNCGVKNCCTHAEHWELGNFLQRRYINVKIGSHKILREMTEKDRDKRCRLENWVQQSSYQTSQSNCSFISYMWRLRQLPDPLVILLFQIIKFGRILLGYRKDQKEPSTLGWIRGATPFSLEQKGSFSRP